jgi:hypothetical protein
MEDQNNIRIIFSDKAESVLDDIIKNFNLDESCNVVIDALTKKFAKEAISEKDFVASLENELKIPQETAQKLSKEILTKIVPMLEKISEEKFKDSDFADALSEKIFGEQGAKNKEGLSDTFLGIKPLTPMSVAEALEENTPALEKELKNKPIVPTKKQERIKKPVILEESKEPTPKPKQSRGPDSYREPIE